jgi:hypothetical protein
LGVVENMSGLRVPIADCRFVAASAVGGAAAADGRAAERDVTAEVWAAVLREAPHLQARTDLHTRGRTD